MVVASDAIEETSHHGGTEEALEHHNGRTKGEFAVEADLLEMKYKIFRFPSNLRRIGTERDYIVPSTVAFGPYYHRNPELQAMEEVKRKAVDYFFQQSAQEQEATYKKMISITRKARNYYADSYVLDGIPDNEFASMMFIDGCFLVMFIDYMIRASTETSWLASMIQPYMIGITRDMMLLENQIPWPVIEFFMALRPLTMGQIIGFVTSCLSGRILSKGSFILDIDQDYQPSHLLCLTRSCIVGRKHVTEAPFFPDETVQSYTSAVELAEMGIKLKPTENTQLSDINIAEGPFFATLSLPPLSLDSIGACWLVNMAAFEMWTETSWTDDCSINSYLAVLSLLMSQEDDVGELRARRIIQGLSNHRALEFFDGLEPGLCPGRAYYRLIVGLAEYKHKRRMWISIYRFLYNNIRTILKVVSLVGVLVGIFTELDQLSEITLNETCLGKDAMCILGKLRILRCLRLLHGSYIECNLNFEAEEFQQLRSLVVDCSGITNISFESGAAPKLKMIIWSFVTMEALFGVEHLPKLKKLELNGNCNLDKVTAAIEIILTSLF
ncbi:hypothetical protein ACP70R_008043 [Stipagrostis hirtigluma subsp. patula]